MIRHHSEPRDPFEVLTEDRLREENEERERKRQQAAAMDAAEERERSERKKRVDAHTDASNKLVMLREYHLCNVNPPPQYIEPDGTPKYSLSFMLKMGWKIEDLGGGERILVNPRTTPAVRRQSKV